MLQRDDIAQIIEDYDRMKLRIGMTASHSALDICDGGIELIYRNSTTIFIDIVTDYYYYPIAWLD